MTESSDWTENGPVGYEPQPGIDDYFPPEPDDEREHASMYATAYTATADDTRTTLAVYRDGEDPERVSVPFPSDADVTHEETQAQAVELLAARGLTVTSPWIIAPDPDRPGTLLKVFRADVAPVPVLF
jgi:hypothetical protein